MRLNWQIILINHKINYDYDSKILEALVLELLQVFSTFKSMFLTCHKDGKHENIENYKNTLK